MRVEVLERLGDDRVRFRSAAGEAVATWTDRPVPDSGSYQVELDVPAEIGWDAIDTDPAADPGLAQTDSGTALTGVLEDLDELGVLTVRLPDGYVLVESHGDPPLGVVGRKIRILTPTITLSPYAV